MRSLARRPRLLALAVVALLVALAAATLLLRDPGRPAGAPGAGPASGSAPASAAGALPADLAAARSETIEDSVYPAVGDPSVDALHYDLDLAWDPGGRTLRGEATITLRATAAAARTGELVLDLGTPLAVDGVRLDGAEVPHRHEGKDLVVPADVEEDQVGVLRVRYSGTPEPVQAPTTRGDFSTTGWTVSDDGDVWTMQEPFGAYSWYPVHDHPSDKAYYDIEVSAPAPLVGVANGVLEARSSSGGVTTTRWHLDEPAASYLVTVGIADYTVTREESASGVPLSYWVQRGDAVGLRAMRRTPEALAWVEERLGAYPFDSLGMLLVDSESGMETQTMITLGENAYVRSDGVIVHEIVHQWYGDLVTPTDWSDLWMNEGMAMYLQLVYEAERDGLPLRTVLDDVAAAEPGMRAEAGPPGDYDPLAFGEAVVYYAPALMWHEVRQRVGDRAFWAMVRDWPAERARGNADRAGYLAWVQERTGADLDDLFDAWLLGEESPPTR